MTKDHHHDIAIIGAGFAGIIAALRLKAEGHTSFALLERSDDLGGTWRDNIYPGCACDVPSHLYSIATEPNPNWTRLFSSQAEIWAYQKTVAEKRQLLPHIRFNTEIVHLQFNPEQGQWQLTARNGDSFTARVVIMATGPLNRPYIPKIIGADLFEGKKMHSATWDTNYDWRDKRVAVIGTGASSIQIVPAIAPDVAHLTVFQRTPAWIMQRNDRPVSIAEQERFRQYPILQQSLRAFIYWLLEIRGQMFIGNRLIHRFATRQSLKKLAKEVHDPETRKKLTPSYPLGCKRILSSDDYLPTFNRDNVVLETNLIREITPTGITTQTGQHYPLDAIIYSTGFVASEIETDWQIIGLNGRSLLEEWKQTGLEAYRGTTVSGYPNLVFVLGPNTGLGHNSVLHIMESQMNYIVQYIAQLKEGKDTNYLDVLPEAQKMYNQALQYLFKGTVWDSGCKSWYMNSKGKNTTLYPRLTRQFRKETSHFDIQNYSNKK